jgi:putative molybdopterin biosynthesis protein
MKQVKQINSLEKMNSLSDPRRIEILQLLMQKPRTISQISRILGEFPAGSRYHIKVLEEAGLVEMSEIRESNGYIEKYYRAVAGAFILHKIILPQSDDQNLVFMGSHDLALEKLFTLFESCFPAYSTINLPVGSMDGLIAVRQGFSQLSGCHIYDPETNDFNSPLLKRFFPERSIQVITLAYREQGLLFAPGNPKHIQGLQDFGRTDISIVNRNQGSGTRLWLDKFLADFKISPTYISGYTQEVNSHSEVAEAIKRGLADLGLGLIAAAYLEGLDCIPLLSERYDLVIQGRLVEPTVLDRLMDILNSSSYRRSVSSLAGYNAIRTGQIIDY